MADPRDDLLTPAPLIQVVGTVVTFNYGDVLFRNPTADPDGGMNRRWQRLRERDPQAICTREVDPTEGWTEQYGAVIGLRTLSNGRMQYGPYDMWDPDKTGTYRVMETFAAYLVVRGMHEKPLRVRVQDVTVLPAQPSRW